MRTLQWLALVAICGGASMPFVATGCAFFDAASDCDRAATCPPGTNTTTTTTDGGGGSIPAGCDPAQNKDAVADTCGAFVSPTGNDDSGKGTKASPFKSFKKALEKNDTIYACVGATTFTEEVVLDKKATLFGGLDCAAWTYDETKRTALTAEPDKIPLKLTSAAGGSAIENFAITAKDAVTLGGSSIAVIAEAVEVSFTRTDITAGNGREGEAGTTPTSDVGPADPEDPAIKGNGGKTACADPAEHTGGSAKENALCPAASGGPIGGKGGAADTLSGSNGDLQPTATAKTALGGTGQTSDDMGAWSCVAGAGLGASGTNGATGDPGDGAKATEAGTISANGYVGVAGKAGGPGLPGQGGGGGGGAKGKTACAGASGGGGGTGGCGGGGGTGGKAGGASIGIVSLGAMLSFDAMTIHVGIGGKGGDGAVGQGGAVGGAGGKGGLGDTNAPATLKACNGGDGGQGGQGGRGGGGRGGHAVGIAHTGATPPDAAGVSFNKGVGGEGGIGDNANGNNGDGAKGATADMLAFQ